MSEDSFVIYVARRALASLSIPVGYWDEYIGAAVLAIIECKRSRRNGRKPTFVRLYYCARDAVLHELKQNRYYSEQNDSNLDRYTSCDQEAAKEAKESLIARGWWLLSEKQRQLLTWRFRDELSYARIGQRIKQSKQEAHRRVKAAIETLKEGI